jgi:hypothetical protein
MDIDIKKDLTSNWFKLLQNAICDDIVKLERTNLNLNLLLGKEILKKMREVENTEFLVMEKYLKKWV